MTSLPISNKAKPHGNTANALPSNTAADAQLAGTQPTGPFAFLLARQIGEANLFIPSPAQTAIAIDGNAAGDSADRALKDVQDQAAAANAPYDPANALAALLMQLPVSEDRGQKADGQQTQPFTLGSLQKADGQQAAQPFTPGSLQKADGQQAQPFTLGSLQKADGQQAQPFTLGSLQKADGQQAQPFTSGPLQKADDQQAQPFTPGFLQKADGQQEAPPFIPDSSQEAGHKTASDSEGSQTIQLPSIGNLPSEVAKHAELPSGMTLPTQNTAQTITSPAMPAAMPNTPLTIATPLGNNGWADELSQKISWISTQQNQVAELHLNPPNLGPLDVVLKISDNQATILFTSPHGAVRDAVENAIPKLREILADNGIMLGNATISDQPPRDRSTDGFMNQGSGTPAQHGVSGTASKPAELPPATAQTILARRHNGMVDTFA